MRSSIHTSIEPAVGTGNTFGWILLLLLVSLRALCNLGLHNLVAGPQFGIGRIRCDGNIAYLSHDRIFGLAQPAEFLVDQRSGPVDNRGDGWVCHHTRDAVCVWQ